MLDPPFSAAPAPVRPGSELAAVHPIQASRSPRGWGREPSTPSPEPLHTTPASAAPSPSRARARGTAVHPHLTRRPRPLPPRHPPQAPHPTSPTRTRVPNPLTAPPTPPDSRPSTPTQGATETPTRTSTPQQTPARAAAGGVPRCARWADCVGCGATLRVAGRFAPGWGGWAFGLAWRRSVGVLLFRGGCRSGASPCRGSWRLRGRVRLVPG